MIDHEVCEPGVASSASRTEERVNTRVAPTSMVQEEKWTGMEQNIAGRGSLEGPALEWFARRYDGIGLGFGLSARAPSSSPSSSYEEYTVWDSVHHSPCRVRNRKSTMSRHPSLDPPWCV